MKTKQILVLAASLLLTVGAYAQDGGVTGKVVSRAGRAAITDAKISIEPSAKTVSTAADGKFTIGGMDPGSYTVRVEAPGYEPTQILVRVGEAVKDMSIVVLVPTVSAEVSVDNEISELDSETEGVDLQASTATLSASKDLFSNMAGYKFSEMRFLARGTESEDVYLNGVQINDALTGYSPWSLWTGLNDATRNQEYVSGAKAGDYGVGGANGQTNINARASQMRKGFRFSFVNGNSSYRFRVMATYASGMLDNGWSYGFSLSTRQGGNGWVDGVYYNTWGYFGSVEKRFNNRHNLAFTVFGTPTQRGAQMASTEEAYSLLGNNFYNPNWGYQNGKMRNARVRNNHEPVFNLGYTYTSPDEKTALNVSATYRFGRNGYSALDWYNANDPRPDYYRNLPSYYLNEGYGKRYFQNNAGEFSLDQWQSWGSFDSSNPEKFAELYKDWSKNDTKMTQIDWDRMYNINRGNTNEQENIIPNGVNIGDRRSKYVIEERRTDQNDFNLKVQADHSFGSNHSVTGGANYRFNRTEYYKILKDLLGGDYWVDVDQFAERDFGDENSMQNDLAHPNRAIYKGDKYGYDYYAYNNTAKLWGVYRFNSAHVDAYAGLEAGYTSFWREGLVEKGLFPTATAANVGQTSLGKSEKQNFLTYRVKAGTEYKINGHNSLQLNGFYLNDAPYFQYSFVSPRTRNAVTPGLSTEKTYGAELTYNASYSFMRLRLSGFYTKIDDQVKVLSFYDDVNRTFTNFAMSGIDQQNYGVEFAVQVPIAVGISFNGCLSLGNYEYTSDPRVTQTVDNSSKTLLENAKVFYKGLKVESTPQTAANVGLSYRGAHNWYAGVDFNMYDRNYLSMNPLYRTQAALLNRAKFTADGDIDWANMTADDKTATHDMMDQEKFKFAWTLNANVGKVWYIQRKYQLGFSLELKNLTNNQTIRTGGYEQTRLKETTENGKLQYNHYASKYFYLYGINYYLNIYFRF